MPKKAHFTFRVATHQTKNKIPDFPLTVKQFSLIMMQDGYSGHESIKIRMALETCKTLSI